MNNKNHIILKDKKSIFIDPDAKIGNNVIIYPNNTIEKGSVIEDNVTLLPGNYITNCQIGEGNKIAFSYLEESVIKSNCQIGPYAHIRPNRVYSHIYSIMHFYQCGNNHLKMLKN